MFEPYNIKIQIYQHKRHFQQTKQNILHKRSGYSTVKTAPGHRMLHRQFADSHVTYHNFNSTQLNHHHHHHGEDGSRPQRPLYPRNKNNITHYLYTNY